MKYRVKVPDFWFGARSYQPGDIIEADNTTEILTNVALGRLVEQPEEQKPTLDPERQAIADRLNEATRPKVERRRYVRRDMRVEDD